MIKGSSDASKPFLIRGTWHFGESNAFDSLIRMVHQGKKFPSLYPNIQSMNSKCNERLCRRVVGVCCQRNRTKIFAVSDPIMIDVQSRMQEVSVQKGERTSTAWKHGSCDSERSMARELIGIS